MGDNNKSKLFQLFALAIAPSLAGRLDSPSAWLLCVGLMTIAAVHDFWVS